MKRSFFATLIAGTFLASLVGAQSLPNWAENLPVKEPLQTPVARDLSQTGPVMIDPTALLPVGERGQSPYQSALDKVGTTQRPAQFGPPCSLTCPPGAAFESEVCGGEDNDGCSTGYCGAGQYEDLLGLPGAGETYCGTAWADGGVRDLDYYRIVLPEAATISVSFASEFPGAVSIVEDPAGDCSSVFVLETAETDSCMTVDLARTVVGGTYYILISTQDFDGTPCGSDNDYTVTVAVDSADAITGACPGTSEIEACGGDTNGGCDAAMMFQGEPASIGTTVCGSVFSDFAAGLRDVDNYTFTVATTSEVTVTVSSDFPALFGIANLDCAGGQLLYGTGTAPGAGVAGTFSAILGPGDYTAFIGTGDEFGPIFAGVDCGDATADYTLDITTAAPPAGCALSCTGIDEGEGCGGDTNAGCNVDPPALDSITLGDTICGTTFAAGGFRDTDWYEFFTFADEEVTITLTSQATLTALILGGDCAGGVFVVAEAHSAGDCVPVSTTIDLAAGPYILLVLPEDDDLNPIFEGYPCGYANDYRLETSTVPSTPGGCSLTVPGGASVEGEACGGQTNNLCLATVPGVTPEFSGPNETWEGTLLADGTRDFDFYEFTITEPSEVTLNLASQLPASASLVFDAVATCPAIPVIAEDLALSDGTCATFTGTSAVLPAGTYYVVVTSGGLFTAPVFSGFPCSSGSNGYVLEIDAVAANSCFIPTGTVTAECLSSDITLDLMAESCYDDVDYVVTDEAGNTVASGTIPGPFVIGDPITATTPAIPTAGVYTVTVTVNCCSGDTAEATLAVGLFPYSGETDIIVDNDLDAGCTDSAQALADALTAAGRTVLVTTFIAGWDCGTDLGPNNTIWVLKGTFPNNVPMSDDEALALITYQQTQGVSIYVEGGDVWGFDAPTAWFDFDGVAGTTIDGTVIPDGDDTFTQMVGVTTPDIDTASFGAVNYNQDSNNPILPAPGALGANDFTDQLAASGDLGLGEDFPAGSTAAVIWVNVDDGIPGGGPEDPYGVATFMVPSDTSFGRVMASSFEFGGFDGDQVALANTYVGALKGSGPPPGPQFRRGDSNGDGGFDISDAIYTLAALFTPGAPPPGCRDAGDANDDEAYDISDAIYTLAALFTPGAPSPPAPGSTCGVDPAGTTLDCAVYGPCP